MIPKFGLDAWLRIGAIVLVLGLIYFFGQSRHAQGASEERLRAAEGSAIVQKNTQASIVTRHDEAIERAERSRQTLEETQQAVRSSQGADAPLPEEVVAAWAAGIDRLRNEARCARDRAACEHSEGMGSALPAADAS